MAVTESGGKPIPLGMGGIAARRLVVCFLFFVFCTNNQQQVPLRGMKNEECL